MEPKTRKKGGGSSRCCGGGAQGKSASATQTKQATPFIYNKQLCRAARSINKKLEMDGRSVHPAEALVSAIWDFGCLRDWHMAAIKIATQWS
jgi:hypothetical protein